MLCDCVVCAQSSMDIVALLLVIYKSDFCPFVPAALSSAACRLVFAFPPKTKAYRALFASVTHIISRVASCCLASVTGSCYGTFASTVCRSFCRSVCLSVRKVYCGKMADWIQMPFGVVSGVSRGMGVLDAGGYRQMGRGLFWG